jgi:G3E family GTPase
MTKPIHLLTGFLGSGKTTLLNRLLAAPAISDSAVLINEFGETAVDHLIVDRIDEDIVILESGCVCCSVRDDLPAALVKLQEKQEDGRMPPVRRVLLETTGIADPLPICQQIMTDEEIIAHYHNGVVLTVVDAVYGGANLDKYMESANQVAIADQLIITKVDLVSGRNLETLARRLRSLNAIAPVFPAGPDSAIDALLQALTEQGVRNRPEQWLQSLGAMTGAIQAQEPGHERRFESFCLGWHDAVSWDDFSAWLEGLLAARGEQILRLKGIVNLYGDPRPTLIQGVQHSFYPPLKLDSWPGGTRTELVVITRDLPREAVVNSVGDVLGIDCP